MSTDDYKDFLQRLSRKQLNLLLFFVTLNSKNEIESHILEFVKNFETEEERQTTPIIFENELSALTLHDLFLSVNQKDLSQIYLCLSNKDEFLKQIRIELTNRTIEMVEDLTPYEENELTRRLVFTKFIPQLTFLEALLYAKTKILNRITDSDTSDSYRERMNRQIAVSAFSLEFIDYE